MGFMEHGIQNALFLLESAFKMIHDYFLLDTVDRQKIRDSKNSIVERSDEIWVFGPISNGVLSEIQLAKKSGKPIRYFAIIDSKDIVEIGKDEASFEEDLEKFRNEI